MGSYSVIRKTDDTRTVEVKLMNDVLTGQAVRSGYCCYCKFTFFLLSARMVAGSMAGQGLVQPWEMWSVVQGQVSLVGDGHSDINITTFHSDGLFQMLSHWKEMATSTVILGLYVRAMKLVLVVPICSYV